ncbi:exonuclease [Gordonia phage Jace]|uniref:Exonuclease n=1 Tax=Gordonia phage Jace TaxID=2182360 RepID=A0A2U8UJ38_9CAUD|nr:exonuclease [Gordonia phage Jace]AWN03667.1 exonuclease [Gordonia phage Jace]
MTTTVGTMPLAAFDLETTGPDPLNDRIVTAHLTRIVTDEHGVTTTNGRNWLLDPGIDIPAGATEVHGITTEHAREHGQGYIHGYDEIRHQLEQAWSHGFAVVVFNAAFDLTMMDAEGIRLGRGQLRPGAVIDPYVIDKAFDQWRKGKRTLAAQCEVYRVRLDNAHEAEADAMAAARLAWKMLRHYDLTTATPAQLADSQARWYAEQQADFARYLRKLARKVDAPDEQGRTADEQRAELEARAAAITGEWPIGHASEQAAA